MQKMGKASQWIRNLFLGKREEKISKKTETVATSTAIIPATPVEKRRWSFGRSSSSTRDKVSHKSTRSFDSIITPQLVSQALSEYANLQQQQQHRRVTGMVVQPKMAVTSTPPAAPKHKALENAAATKIQACFRSYLARKALCALRGLVKLQALVRGHLVRKQTTAMVRGMNALISIQVRARVHRILMAEESYLITRTRKVHIEQAQENRLSTEYGEMKDLRGIEGMRSQNGYLSHPQTDTMGDRLSTYSSGRMSVSRRDHRHLYPNSSPSMRLSSRSYDQQVEGLSLSTTHRSSGQYSSRAIYGDSCTSPSLTNADHRSSHHQLEPRSYMADTESSMAKVRSHSEPKQRPVKNKSRRTASNEGITDIMHNSSSYLRGNVHKNQNHWLVKLYRSSNSTKDIEFDSTSTSTNMSFCRTLIGYEPVVSLY